MTKDIHRSSLIDGVRSTNDVHDAVTNNVATRPVRVTHGRSPQAQALDIDVYEFNMKMAMNGNQTGANGTFTGAGQIVSRSQGKIVMAVNGTLQGNQQGSISTVVTSMKYPDGLSIEFKNVTAQTGKDAPPVNTYFINDAPVTEKVFQKYTKSFGMDKSGQQSGTAAPATGQSANR